MVLQLQDLHELFGPPASGVVDPEPGAGSDGPGLTLCTDSRRLQPGQVFVALAGETFDGHDYLDAAITAGACAVVFEPRRLEAGKGSVLPHPAQPGCLLWGVDDSLAAYQQLARRARSRLQAPVIAVTGSAGKTTTRELIRAALAPLGPIWASSGNENNDIGVPLTLLGADATHRAVVVEMGMRGLGEIERLSVCAQPDIAVITNIGTAHIGRLGSREAIGTAKCEITAALRPDGLVVIPAGDPLLEQALARVWSGRVLRVALAGDPMPPGTLAPDLSAQIQADGSSDSMGESLQLDDGSLLPLPLPGRHNARNLLLALAVAGELGVPLSAHDALTVAVPGGRSRRLHLAGLTVLDETYNASPEAVLAALDLLAAEPGRHVAVLGTMLELGEHSIEQHRRVAAHAAALGLDGLVIVDAGAEGRAMAEAAAQIQRLAVVAQPEAAAAPLGNWLRTGDTLLLKASRGVALERLIPLLPGLTKLPN